MGTKWEQIGNKNPKVGQEWGQSEKKGTRTTKGPKWLQEPRSGARMGTKWEQSRGKNLKVGQEWEQSGNKVGARTPKWGKNGKGTGWEQELQKNENKAGTEWEQEPQSEARMGTKWEQRGAKNPKVGQEWEQSGHKAGTRTPK